MSIEVHEQGTVAASPEALWPLVSDPERLAEWFTFAERVEVLEGEGVGQRRRQHGHWGSKPSEIDQRITAWEPPHRLAWCHEAERLAGKPAPRFSASTDFEIVLEPAEDGASRVSLRSVQEPASAVRGVVIRLFGRREVAQHLRRSLARLEELSGETALRPDFDES
jgi:uncharacterized protein YndB with AHSA1/START domain